MENIVFPQGFLWGAATAAFQVEGATGVDGRTDSIWDAFCRLPGKVVGGDTGEPGADHYRRFEQDVAMMAAAPKTPANDSPWYAGSGST